MTTRKPNSTGKLVQQINDSANQGVPELRRQEALTKAFTSSVKYAETTGIFIEEWNDNRAVVTLKNRPHVQNHIGGVHATAMATLAESATGMVFGMNVPDSHLALAKSMKVKYVAVANGDLKAVASLTQEQKQKIQSSDRGSVIVPVTVTDSVGKEPIRVEMEWAWVKRRSNL